MDYIPWNCFLTHYSSRPVLVGLNSVLEACFVHKHLRLKNKREMNRLLFVEYSICDASIKLPYFVIYMDRQPQLCPQTKLKNEESFTILSFFQDELEYSTGRAFHDNCICLFWIDEAVAILEANEWEPSKRDKKCIEQCFPFTRRIGHILCNWEPDREVKQSKRSSDKRRRVIGTVSVQSASVLVVKPLSSLRVLENIY